MCNFLEKTIINIVPELFAWTGAHRKARHRREMVGDVKEKISALRSEFKWTQDWKESAIFYVQAKRSHGMGHMYGTHAYSSHRRRSQEFFLNLESGEAGRQVYPPDGLDVIDGKFFQTC